MESIFSQFLPVAGIGMVLSVCGRESVEVVAKNGALHTIDFGKPFMRISIVEALESKLGLRLPLLEENGIIVITVIIIIYHYHEMP